MKVHLRHDISDHMREILKKQLMGRKGARGRNASINGRVWILQTGAPWRNLPEDYGYWKNVHRCFCRWRNKGEWERLLELLVNESDFEWLMIDTSHVKVHPYAAGAVGGNQDMGCTKAGSTPRYVWAWVCRSEYLLRQVPQRIANLEKG